MFNRALVVDENFSKFVKAEIFPENLVSLSPKDVGLSPSKLIEMFESQVLSRHLDFQARILKDNNLSYYTIGSSGHEGSSAVAEAFRVDDMAFLHYRSGGFMIQRSKQLPGSTVLYDMMLSFLASSEDPISGGRHKVFGSLALSIPPQTSTIASHLPKAVGAAFSLTKAKDLKIENKIPSDAVILCSFGDASLNHSTSQGALNTAQWTAYRKIPMPIVFICEDNGIGISVSTPPNWVEKTNKHREAIRYIKGDALNLIDGYRAAKEAEIYSRATRQPVFLHLRTVRLMGHAGSDMENEYKTMKEIEANEFNDPLLFSAQLLLKHEFLSKDDILTIYEKTRAQVANAAKVCLEKPKLVSAEQVMASIIPQESSFKTMAQIAEFSREELFGRNFKNLDKPKNLAQSINTALFDAFNQYKNIVLFGEDVAKKGGVYNVSNGLHDKFGGRRVFNTLLDEQSILGLAIGMSHNGFLPIPEIQFLAYYHNAEDQIRGEASTLSFFSNSQFTNPMLIRIAGLAYQKGFGGHFHNDNSLAALRDIPGVILCIPSNAEVAPKLLRSCLRLAQEERRIVFFVEPIALYMSKDLHEVGDNAWMSVYSDINSEIKFGDVSSFGNGKDLAIVSYGNGYYLSRQAQKILETTHKINSKVIDLQWLSPLPIEALKKELIGYKHVLIVDECRKTGSPSEELITLMLEQFDNMPKIRRLTGHDSFIPLGNAWKFVLPDKERIVEVAIKLLSKN